VLASSAVGVAADSDWLKKSNAGQKKQARTSIHQAERLSQILGTQVVASDGEKVGKLNNLVVDLESGHVLMALVGTGEGRVALPPGVFSGANREEARLNISREKVRNAPRVSDEMMNREHLSQASFVNKVHEQFNQSAWWKGAGGAGEGKFNNVHAGENLIGMKVRNVMDKNVGEVKNALIDLPAGRVVYVVIDPSKDMDLGDKLVALPPSALTLGKDGKSLVSDIDKNKLSDAPSFARDSWPSATDKSFASRVYSHFGKQAYFESGSFLQPTGRDENK
jgi:sporulation protein YlmC with PRC-barrel domain